MTPIILPFDPTVGNQTLFLAIDPDGIPLTLSVNIRYHNAPGRYYLTVTDILSGEVLLNNIPAVPSGTAINDLLSTARNRLPGTLFLTQDGTTLVWMDCQSELPA